MLSNSFDNVVNNTFFECLNLLNIKAKQYAPIDRHENFKITAKIRDKEPEEALLDMWMKHLTWLLRSIDEISDRCPNIAQWDERIMDTINYMVLLKGLVIERLQIPVSIKYNLEFKNREGHVRSVILDFAIEMEKKMAANDHKPGWRQYSQSFLAGKLVEEVSELLLAIDRGESPEDIIQEAADVGNYAMMIADIVNENKKITLLTNKSEGDE